MSALRRARLSALTLAALATGYYPMAQPQNRVSSRRGAKVFCLFAADALS